MKKPALWQRMLGLFTPVNLDRSRGEGRQVLEVNYYKGMLTLDGATVNYSGGSLKSVMEQAILHAHIVYDAMPESALILGYGAGSAADILLQMFPGIDIAAVESDSEVVRLSECWFPERPVRLICRDALEFIKNANEEYDLIICDLFTEDVKPGFSLQPEYYHRIAELLRPDGVFIQNTMFEDDAYLPAWNLFKDQFVNESMLRLMGVNHVFCGQRL